jgi:AcrR family transcriptional regulator
MAKSSRQQILAAAQRAFARYGYDGATIARLEAEIGLSRGAIFHYFRDKLGIFVELAVDLNRHYSTLIRQQGFEATIRELARENPDWLSVLIEVESRMRRDSDFARRVDALQAQNPVVVDDWFTEQQQNGHIRADIPPSDLEQFVSLILHGLAIRIVAGDRINVDVVVRLVDDAIGTREPGSS